MIFIACLPFAIVTLFSTIFDWIVRIRSWDLVPKFSDWTPHYFSTPNKIEFWLLEMKKFQIFSTIRKNFWLLFSRRSSWLVLLFEVDCKMTTKKDKFSRKIGKKVTDLRPLQALEIILEVYLPKNEKPWLLFYFSYYFERDKVHNFDTYSLGSHLYRQWTPGLNGDIPYLSPWQL